MSVFLNGFINRRKFVKYWDDKYRFIVCRLSPGMLKDFNNKIIIIIITSKNQDDTSNNRGDWDYFKDI